MIIAITSYKKLLQQLKHQIFFCGGFFSLQWLIIVVDNSF